MNATEYNFDGLVGPTHSYAGLSHGNLASISHSGQVGNPRAAALQGLQKMRLLASLGVGQAVLPPQPRPDVEALRRLGFRGDHVEILQQAALRAPELLQKCSSASAMWTANAATVIPSADSLDSKLHLVPANLSAMFHRSLEAPTTGRILKRVFGDEQYFEVHEPVLSSFGDEGAANHTRLYGQGKSVHLFAWGRRADVTGSGPRRFVARQSLEASQAVARLGQVRDEQLLLWQQEPRGIDAGAFHTDVLAVGNEGFLMLHELAFVECEQLLAELGSRLGAGFCFCLAKNDELPVADAVSSYPFNSQLVSLPDGRMTIVAPREAELCVPARRFLERVLSEPNPVNQVRYVDVNASMNNGGGPACLRLRVSLTPQERAAIVARVFFDAALDENLQAWVKRHYREQLSKDDLGDPQLLNEVRTALDELTQILDLGCVYDFQNG